MARQFTLGQKERLKGRKIIERLFTEGKNFLLTPYRVHYLLVNISSDQPGSSLQFGVGVSAKNFKKATDRNRIKRLTREGYRVQKNDLHAKLKTNNLRLHLFLIYTGKEVPVFTVIHEKLNLILKRLTKVIDENDSASS